MERLPKSSPGRRSFLVKNETHHQSPKDFTKTQEVPWTEPVSARSFSWLSKQGKKIKDDDSWTQEGTGSVGENVSYQATRHNEREKSQNITEGDNRGLWRLGVGKGLKERKMNGPSS